MMKDYNDEITRKQFCSKCLNCVLGISALSIPASQNIFAKNFKEADYWEKLPGSNVQCTLCPNGCKLSPGKDGKCHARGNHNGKLYSLVYGRPSVIALDHIEKSPLYHYRLKNKVFSIATAGCNLSCAFCQNWEYSQFGPSNVKKVFEITPEDVIKRAKKYNINAINFFYTEPTIYFEYMKDVAILAKKNKMKTFCVTAGYINKEPIQELIPLIDAFIVGLKGFDEKFYQKYIGVRLEPVKKTLKLLANHKKDTWFEIVNLLIPGLNDSNYSLKRMTSWIKREIGVDVPLHFTRFEPYYKMKKTPATPLATLKRAYDIAKKSGLNFVYMGNVPGTEAANTYCPKCNKSVVERVNFLIVDQKLKKGRCSCGYVLPGKWKE